MKVRLVPHIQEPQNITYKRMSHLQDFIHELIKSFASSDVLQDMRVNVSEEGTEKVIWYKVKKDEGHPA